LTNNLFHSVSHDKKGGILYRPIFMQITKKAVMKNERAEKVCTLFLPFLFWEWGKVFCGKRKSCKSYDLQLLM